MIESAAKSQVKVDKLRNAERGVTNREKVTRKSELSVTKISFVGEEERDDDES